MKKIEIFSDVLRHNIYLSHDNIRLMQICASKSNLKIFMVHEQYEQGCNSNSPSHTSRLPVEGVANVDISIVT